LIGTVGSGTKTQQDIFNYFPAQTCVMAGGKEVEKYLAEITKQERVLFLDKRQCNFRIHNNVFQINFPRGNKNSLPFCLK
jgi:hypothetical protein